LHLHSTTTTTKIKITTLTRFFHYFSKARLIYGVGKMFNKEQKGAWIYAVFANLGMSNCYFPANHDIKVT